MSETTFPKGGRVFDVFGRSDVHPDGALHAAGQRYDDYRVIFSRKSWAGSVLARLATSEAVAGVLRFQDASGHDHPLDLRVVHYDTYPGEDASYLHGLASAADLRQSVTLTLQHEQLDDEADPSGHMIAHVNLPFGESEGTMRRHADRLIDSLLGGAEAGGSHDIHLVLTEGDIEDQFQGVLYDGSLAGYTAQSASAGR